MTAKLFNVLNIYKQDLEKQKKPLRANVRQGRRLAFIQPLATILLLKVGTKVLLYLPI